MTGKGAATLGKGDERACCDNEDTLPSRFRMEALVTVDERGQMVLPKDLRERAGIGPGDKLALISWEKEGSVCCFTLIRSEEFAEMAKGLLGPLMSDILGK